VIYGDINNASGLEIRRTYAEERKDNIKKRKEEETYTKIYSMLPIHDLFF